MLKIVIDTNILVSALMKPDSKPARVFDTVPDKLVRLYYSEGIMHEYRDVLTREKFHFDKVKYTTVFNRVKKFGVLLTLTPYTHLLPDETDRVFYDTAVAAGAYLVTGNMKHYPNEPFILTPADFVALLEMD